MNNHLDLIKILYGQEIVSGQEIANKLGISRNMVWKKINALCSLGFKIDSYPKGYKLISFPTDITKEEILTKIDTTFDVLVFDTLPSTNDYAKQNISSFSKNTIIIAKEQTSGKGRFNRKFYSSKGGLYLTMVFKESLDISYASLITLFTAVKVCETIEKVADIKCDIKWVNDIYHSEKKICGILSEASISCEQKTVFDYIIGIGINVDNKLESEISDIATSLSVLQQKPINKSILCAEIIKNMQNLTAEIVESDFINTYKQRLFILGKKVFINEQEALVLDLNKDGSLKVQMGEEIKTFYAGDVSLKL